ncbi:(+)-neomenthol dehydrogenase-like isoform X1 [Tripterygium wilfordii]|uniref:(+)-neomenthol dehydrogenase-like isoform X1 n=1 Tax=Tripterygium wilfordii TaxID=458696 RepID=UPI0018F83208|nr:(+)-neomenthol dehydrogenase-like isoform X1 [Tripterygium wilfordii]
MKEATKYAVVTGANKGIGFEVVRQLASNGSSTIKVVLTARDEKRGIEAVDKLIKEFGLSAGNVFFHQLDLTDPASASTLADFVKTQFGKLDILVNNAGISGVIFDPTVPFDIDLSAEGVSFPIKLHSHKILSSGKLIVLLMQGTTVRNMKEIATHTYDLAQDCLNTNYYGTKTVTEALLPLLKLSDSPKIVNVSSIAGLLKSIPNEEIRAVFNNIESLTEKKIHLLLSDFLKDFKEGSLETKGWPTYLSAYQMSKAAINAYTRLLAKNYPEICINCICPGIVKTDMNRGSGILTREEGGAGPVKLAQLPNGSPSGLFFVNGKVSSF